MKALAAVVLIFLALVFAVPICARLGNWLFGDPLAGGPILLVAIVGVMILGALLAQMKGR